jgi:hypothetical protein
LHLRLGGPSGGSGREPNELATATDQDGTKVGGAEAVVGGSGRVEAQGGEGVEVSGVDGSGSGRDVWRWRWPIVTTQIVVVIAGIHRGSGSDVIVLRGLMDLVAVSVAEGVAMEQFHFSRL